jgi:hypothetical protein
MSRFLQTILLLTLTLPALAQRSLYIFGGVEFSSLTRPYTMQQEGAVLRRGWLDTKGNQANGIKFAGNVAIQRTLGKRFALETGMRFLESGLSVYDHQFLTNHSVKGGAPKNNINGTYSDNGNFNIAEWYLSNFLSAYYFLPFSSNRLEPFLSAGVAYNYFVSKHSEISNSYYDSPSNETLTLTGHFVPNYISSFVEAGIQVSPGARTIGKKNKEYILQIGVKYYLAGKVVHADFKNSQGAATNYTDQVNASGSTLALSLRVGRRLMF